MPYVETTMLVLHMILQAGSDALTGDPDAETWVLTTGNKLLANMGWGAIDMSCPEMINLELIDRTLGNDPVRRCRDCAHCVRSGNYAACTLNVWERWGLKPEYSIKTVEKGNRGKIHACGRWEGRSPTD